MISPPRKTKGIKTFHYSTKSQLNLTMEKSENDDR